MRPVGLGFDRLEAAIIGLLRRLGTDHVAARVVIVATAGVVGLALNWLTGPATSMVLVYSITTALTAWMFAPHWPGLAMAIGLAVGSGLIVSSADDNTTTTAIVWLNALFRGASLGLLALIVSALRRLIADTESAARLDALTGVDSRHSILHELNIAVRHAQRTGSPTSVVYFDLDGLKSVNDRNGHAAGDELIRRFAREVRHVIRPDDRLGRIGGDEFLMICRGTTESDAELVVRRIFATTCAPAASWGIACTRSGRDPSTLIAEADRQMYARKRNRKRVASGAVIDLKDTSVRPAMHRSTDREADEVLPGRSHRPAESAGETAERPVDDGERAELDECAVHVDNRIVECRGDAAL